MSEVISKWKVKKNKIKQRHYGGFPFTGFRSECKLFNEACKASLIAYYLLQEPSVQPFSHTAHIVLKRCSLVCTPYFLHKLYYLPGFSMYHLSQHLLLLRISSGKAHIMLSSTREPVTSLHYHCSSACLFLPRDSVLLGQGTCHAICPIPGNVSHTVKTQ